MIKIHWLGAGLSSIPGIKRLASNNEYLTVWNRTLPKAQKCIDQYKSDNITAKKFDMNEIKKCLKEGDILDINGKILGKQIVRQ